MGLIFSLLFGLSLIIRGVSIPSLPPELFGDEIDIGYQAYSLLHTGRDLYGQAFPTYIHSLSEWRTPLLMYFTVPTIALFGNTEWGVRGPEVILGSLAPMILFILVYETSRNKTLSLLSGIVLALMPWHILYSRTAFEAVLLLDFVLIGTILFLKKKTNLSLSFFFLTPYIYSTASLFTPLWLAFLFWYRRPGLSWIRLIPVLILIPFAGSLIFGKAAERFGKVGLFTNSEIMDDISTYRQESSSPFERLFTNRPVFVIRKIYANYLSAFSPEFLFVRGDSTARQSLQYIGELYPVWAPFLFIGLISLARKKAWLWLSWLFIAPIPAALTYDGAYHATRLFMMIPPLAFAIGTGIREAINVFPRQLKVSVYVMIWVLVGAQFIFAASYYVNHYPVRTWVWWHVGFKSAMQEVQRLAPQYEKVFINNTYEPALIRFLFYSNYSPADFHKYFTVDKPSDISPGYYGFYLKPKYYFGGFSPPPNKSLIDVMQPGNLYVVSQRDDLPGDWDWRTSPPGGVKVLYTSLNPLGKPVFYLVTKI